MYDQDEKNNNLELQKGSTTVESEFKNNSQHVFFENLSFIEIISRNFETVYQKQIFSTDNLITYCLQELANNKDQFIKNESSLNDLIFKTYHNLPSILIENKKYMHCFLTCFINEFKRTEKIGDSFTEAIYKIPSMYTHDFTDGIIKSDNLLPVIRKFRDLYITTLLTGRSELESIHDFIKISENEFNNDINGLNISIKKSQALQKIRNHINNKINKSQLTKANEIASFCLSMDAGKILTKRIQSQVDFLVVSIKVGNTIYELSNTVMKTYKYLYLNKDANFTLRQLHDNLEIKSQKLSKKSLFGNLKKSNFKKAYCDLVDELKMHNDKNNTYKWR